MHETTTSRGRSVTARRGGVRERYSSWCSLSFSPAYALLCCAVLNLRFERTALEQQREGEGEGQDTSRKRFCQARQDENRLHLLPHRPSIHRYVYPSLPPLLSPLLLPLLLPPPLLCSDCRRSSSYNLLAPGRCPSCCAYSSNQNQVRSF